MKQAIPNFVLLLFILIIPPLHAEQTSISEDQQAYREWAQSIWDSLDRKSGEIKLANNVATLNIPEAFYYLSPEDTEKVLVEIWGNPPGQQTLGMIFPSHYTPFDDNAWGVTLGYEEDGYVDDKNAESIDYDDLLEQMQADTAAANEQRVQQGYQKIALVGWAARPFYDASAKKIYWAKELAFSGEPQNTLNYNIRALGRKGVLVMNFIAGMGQLEEINTNLDTVLALAEFNEGFRYQDFDPDIDEVAAYGVGALVAGKVLAKTGLIATVLLALKKFWIIIAVALFGVVKTLFGRKKKEAVKQ